MGLFGVGAHSKSLGQSNSASGWIRLPDGNFKWPIRAALILFIACNGFVVLTFLVHPSSGIVPHWVIPTAPFAAVILGFLYYFLVFWSSASQDRLAQTHNSGHFQTLRQQCSLLTFAGVTCNIDKDVFYAARYKSLVRRFGTQRIITFEVTQATRRPDLANVHLSNWTTAETRYLDSSSGSLAEKLILVHFRD